MLVARLHRGGLPNLIELVYAAALHADQQHTSIDTLTCF